MMNKKSRGNQRQRKARRHEAREATAPHHYDQLDALRGLAAVLVVVSHFFDLGVYQHITSWQIVGWYAAHQAVILFFVLSGFVLALPFQAGQKISYISFVCRRLARIWVPYVVLVLATFCWRAASRENSVAAMPLDQVWQTPLSGQLLFSYLSLIGNVDYDALIPSAWTLVYEVRISMVFPLLYLLGSRLSWPWTLGLALLFSLGGNLGSTLLAGDRWVAELAPLETFHYAALFLIGIMLARYRAGLVAWRQRLSPVGNLLFFLGTLLLYAFPFYNPYSGSQRMLGDLVTMFGCAGWILLAVSTSRRFSGPRLLVSLGRVSYSLYLIHLPVMLALSNLLFLRVPDWIYYSLLLSGVMLGTFLFWHGVERPALAWSRRLRK